MKKITQLLSATFIVASLLLLPVVAQAQDVPVVEVGTSDPDPVTTSDVTPTSTTTDTTAGVPSTGFAPQPSKLAQYTVTFILGGSIGAAVGFGIVSLKKRSRSQL